MPVAFRNLNAHPEDPVSSWPTEAVQAALERGGLSEWRRLAGEIADDPWGRTARQVEEVLSHSRPYGVAELLEGVLSRARERTELCEREEVVAELKVLITHSGLTQAAFAARMGTSPSRLSSYVNGHVTPAATLLIRARRVAG